MFYLLLAIFSSAFVSIFMRLSSDKVSGNISMLAMNYLTCVCLSAGSAGLAYLFPKGPSLPSALGMGAVQGILFLLTFILLQFNVKKNGVVLSSIFMKLGLLIPMAVSLIIFREIPTWIQILGFVIAIIAILLINLEKDQSAVQFKAGLVLLLFIGGCADTMSKIFEELGDSEYSEQFLFYTFLVAFLLCIGLILWKKQRIRKYEFIYGILVGIPNFFSARFLLKALNSVPAVIAYPTYSVATILIVTLTGVLFFKERLGKRQWLAIGIILIALALLNL